MTQDNDKKTKRVTRDQAGLAIDKLKEKAAALAKDPELVASLLKTASTKAAKHQEQIRSLRTNLFGLIRLLKAWAGGRYQKVPWPTLVMAVSGILYFLNPMDLIPDFIVGAGYIDDATVLGLVLKAIKHDVKDFVAWEEPSEGAKQDV